MEYTREIYWNVGHGAWTLLPMYLLVLLALGLLVKGFYTRIKVYRQGLPLARSEQWLARLKHMSLNVVLQLKVRKVAWPGMLHALFFWGFGLLVIGTALIVIQADFTDLLFGVKFLTGPFYKLFSVVLDIAGLVCIVMLAGLLFRRYFFAPDGLETTRDDALMHGLLFIILITGFLIEGSRMAVTELHTPLAAWSPIGLFIAQSIQGMGNEGLLAVHKITWWFHMLLVMFFFLLIPSTKFRHILTTSANYFFADLGPKGKLVSLDIEDEEAESFGVSKIDEMSWKDIFDTDACTRCMRCQDRCPAFATGKPLSPMKFINQLGDLAFNRPDSALLESIDKDVLWSCTTCRACQEICPAAIEHVNKIVDLRRFMVLMEGEFPGEEVLVAMEAAEVNGNPLGVGYAGRADWIENLGISTLAEDRDVEVLFFVGCYGSFDKRNIAVARSFVQLCQAAGVKVGILGKDEKCCGEPIRKMGNEYLYQILAAENIEKIKSYGIQKIVTTCPHCFNTLEKDYRDLGLDAEVINYTVFLEQLIAEGRLTLRAEKLSCTYHDSCYLGRHNDIYDSPRKLIELAGGQLVEMEKTRNEAFCCSAGGGRIMAEEKIGERINIKRVQMAAKTKTGILVSNCPFCLTMFEDGIKGAELEGTLKTLDIAEILAERIV